jgi:hypothetical protein
MGHTKDKCGSHAFIFIFRFLRLGPILHLISFFDEYLWVFIPTMQQSTLKHEKLSKINK